MSIPLRFAPTVIVQTNTDLSADDSTWLTLQLCLVAHYSTGAGQIAGGASFSQQFGLTTTPNQLDPVLSVGTNPSLNAPGPDDSLVGQLVRFLVSDDDGNITVGQQTYSECFYGQITGFAIDPDGRDDVNAGGVAVWSCAGPLSILDQMVIGSGYCLAPDDDAEDWVDPGFCPPFNAAPSGDMSLTQYSINGTMCSIHDLTTLTPVGVWQATDIVTLLLAGFAQATYGGAEPTGFAWVLNDPQSVLDYDVERLDLDGQTLGHALNILIDSRRGITFTITIAAGVATVNVYSCTDTTITVGAFTLPASTNTNTYTVAGNVFASPPSISEDQAATYDIIEVRGARPWVGISLYYNTTGQPSLIKGWNPSLETDWAMTPSLAVYEQVWRLFRVDPQWDGSQYNSGAYGMRVVLGTGNPGGGYDGTRTVDTSDSTNPPASIYGMERATPSSPGFSTARLGPRQLPLIIAGNGTSGNWTDYSNPGPKGSWGIDCQQDPPTVRIDDGQCGLALDAIIEDSTPGTVIVTVGMREAQPLKVSYIFDRSNWPRSTPRIKIIKVPELEQWVILPGTVTGVDLSGNLTTESSLLSIRDDTAKANQILALAVARYGYPVINARFTEMSLLDNTDALAPGVLLSNIVLGTGNVYVGSVITRRTVTRVTRDDVDQWDTTYETTRIQAEDEVVL